MVGGDPISVGYSGRPAPTSPNQYVARVTCRSLHDYTSWCVIRTFWCGNWSCQASKFHEMSSHAIILESYISISMHKGHVIYCWLCVPSRLTFLHISNMFRGSVVLKIGKYCMIYGRLGPFGSQYATRLTESRIKTLNRADPTSPRCMIVCTGRHVKKYTGPNMTSQTLTHTHTHTHSSMGET